MVNAIVSTFYFPLNRLSELATYLKTKKLEVYVNDPSAFYIYDAALDLDDYFQCSEEETYEFPVDEDFVFRCTTLTELQAFTQGLRYSEFIREADEATAKAQATLEVNSL